MVRDPDESRFFAKLGGHPVVSWIIFLINFVTPHDPTDNWLDTRLWFMDVYG